MKRDFAPAVYIMASARNGTLYIGVTSDLPRRIWQHRQGLLDGFTRRHHIHLLVWYEVHETMESAIRREKSLKEWNRRWKIELIAGRARPQVAGSPRSPGRRNPMASRYVG